MRRTCLPSIPFVGVAESGSIPESLKSRPVRVPHIVACFDSVACPRTPGFAEKSVFRGDASGVCHKSIACPVRCSGSRIPRCSP